MEAPRERLEEEIPFWEIIIFRFQHVPAVSLQVDVIFCSPPKSQCGCEGGEIDRAGNRKVRLS